MKEKISRLPDAELAIMKIIWAKGGEVTSAEISTELEGKKEWAATTVLNFLARLADRDFLSVTRSGKTNLYAPLVNEQDYLRRESKSFLERMHGNSLKSLVAALYGGEAVSADDLAELKSFIDEQARQTQNIIAMDNEGERTNG
jgi:predicted transcriptional regulator